MSAGEALEPEPLEESPFDEDDDSPGLSAPTPWLPAKPLTQDELDHYSRLPFEIRTFNPWACMFNKMAEDGIGYYSGHGRIQCDVLLADPTKSRYCLEHAAKMGVDYYAPTELAEAVDKETATNLTRLVPKAVRTLEKLMDDEDAPHGVRGKAAADVLDRTGYTKGLDVRVEAKISVIDNAAIISDRLNALRDAHRDRLAAEAEARAAAAAAEEDGAAGDDSASSMGVLASGGGHSFPRAESYPPPEPSGAGVEVVQGEIISRNEHDRPPPEPA